MTREELGKLKFGDIIINSENQRRIFLGIIKNYFITCHENGSAACDWELFECQSFSLLLKPKKRYWLWDIAMYGTERVVKHIVYMDDNGRNPTGLKEHDSEVRLIRKHENEYIEVDE